MEVGGDRGQQGVGVLGSEGELVVMAAGVDSFWGGERPSG
mgnify:CR=1 FL=1